MASYVGSGIFQKGQAGELVARIILLLAMDKGHYGNTSVVYKTLGDFLKDLGGIEFYNLLSEDFSQDLLQGFVSFSQFISMDRTIFDDKEIPFRVTQELLKEAFIYRRVLRELTW